MGGELALVNVDAKKTLDTLAEIAREAGAAILEVYGFMITVEEKADKSPLTLADKRSHDIITKRLQERFPFPVLSEEGKSIPFEERRQWGYYWLVDPLDGTKEFVKRGGDFTVNIALMHRDRPVAGVILVPVTGVLYHAAAGAGSYRTERGRRERLPIETGRSGMTVVGSRSHVTREMEQYLNDMKKKYGEIEVVSVGSSLKFCMIAEGGADVYPRLGPTMEWDTAAGQIIVEEAGGKVVEFETGRPLRYNKENLLNPFFLASGGGVHV
jgi:3'(2'), 5'-bisphosphate nucleotidase